MKRLFLIFLLMTTEHPSINAQEAGEMMIRISEIKLFPKNVDAYKAILKEEAAASVKLEPGVISILPMFRKTDTTQVRILEIYASRQAYESHLRSPHFLHYKTATQSMVKSLQLIDMEAIDPETLPLLFRKLAL